MEVTKQQIVQFFANKCSAEEARLVANYLKKNPGVLDELFNEQEWEEFEPVFRVNAATDRRILAAIKKKKQQPVLKFLISPKMRVAAGILLCMAGWLLYIQLNKTAPSNKGVAKVASKSMRQQVVLANTTSNSLQYQLEDSSVIVLSKNSQVTYQAPFDTNKRELQLEGEAFFKVTKDAHRPFTVFTKGFSTTALGTSFTISAFKTASVARVKLLTGKVVVKNLQKLNNAIYLTPGQECAFDYAAGNLARQSLSAALPNAVSPIKPPAAGSIEENEDYVSFKNTPLPEVMQMLSKIYHVHILYDNVALQKKKFIGRLDKKNTIEAALQTIALLNELQVDRRDNEFIITNKK